MMAQVKTFCKWEFCCQEWGGQTVIIYIYNWIKYYQKLSSKQSKSHLSVVVLCKTVKMLCSRCAAIHIMAMYQTIHRSGCNDIWYNTTVGMQLLLPHHTTTVLRPFFWDHPRKPVPEENFWTLWCKGRLTEAETQTIRMGATPSGLRSAHLYHPPIFYRPHALPAAQPTVSKHWRQMQLLLAINKWKLKMWTKLWQMLAFLKHQCSATTQCSWWRT